MYNNFIYFIFLFLYSFVKGEYIENDLINGELFEVYQFKKQQNEFKFYIKAFQFQNVSFTFYCKQYNVIKEVFFYEYSNRHSQIATVEKRLSFENDTFPGYFYFIPPYTVNESSTNYVAIRFEVNETLFYYLWVRPEVTNYIYNLSIKENKKIDNIVPGGSYIFYIPANEDQNVTINITTKTYNYPSFYKALITEYESKSDPIHTSSDKNLSFITLNNGTEIVSMSSYIVSSDGKNFGSRTFFLRLQIDVFPIDYFSIKADIVKKEFFLTVGNISEFNVLNAGLFYYFSFEAEIKKIYKINFELNGLYRSTSIDIYEFKNKYNHEYTNKENYVVSFKTNDYKKYFSLTNFSAKNSTTNFISFRMKPPEEMKKLKIFLETEDGEIIFLKYGDSKNIYNITKESSYFFIINVNRFEIVFINLSIDNLNKQALTKLDIIENVAPNNITSQNISFSKKNNTLVATNSYMSFNEYINYITIKIIPNYEIEFLNILIDFQKGEYELDHNKNKIIYNLKSNNKYYLFKWINTDSYLNISFVIDFMENQPFNYVYIYYCDSGYGYCEQKNYQIINFEKNGNESISSFIYKIGKPTRRYLYIEILPEYDISYIIPKLNYIDNKKKNNKSNNNTILILSIVLSCVIFITIITIVILKYFKKYKNSKNSNLNSSPSEEVLYTT